MLKYLIPFRKNRQSPGDTTNLPPDRITRNILKLQQKIVVEMGHLEQHFTSKEKKIILISYLAVMSIYFSVLMYTGLFLHIPEKKSETKQNNIIAPIDTHLPDSLNLDKFKKQQKAKDGLE